MLSNLQQRKLSKMFRLLDSNQDGVLERADYMRTSSRLQSILGLAAGSPQATEVQEWYTVEWQELEELAAKRGEGRVTQAVWIAYRDAMLSGADPFEVMIEPYVAVVFKGLDIDEDGLITHHDLVRYFGVYEMSDVEKREILAKIDPQQRGSFTWPQFRELAWQYHLSNEESAPGSWLLGRFPDAHSGDSRSTEDIACWLAAEIARLVGTVKEAIALDEPITNYLVDSRDALTLAANLQDWLGVEFPADIIWDHPTIAALSAHAFATVGNREISRAPQ